MSEGKLIAFTKTDIYRKDKDIVCDLQFPSGNIYTITLAHYFPLTGCLAEVSSKWEHYEEELQAKNEMMVMYEARDKKTGHLRIESRALTHEEAVEYVKTTVFPTMNEYSWKARQLQMSDFVQTSRKEYIECIEREVPNA